MRPYSVGSVQQSVAAGKFLESVASFLQCCWVHPKMLWIWYRNYWVRKLPWFYHTSDLSIRSNYQNDPFWLQKNPVNVNEREMSDALWWCVPLALFHSASCCAMWLRSWDWFSSGNKRRKSCLGKWMWRAGKMKSNSNLLCIYVFMCLCCSCPSLRQHPWAATSEYWPCLSPCCCPAAGWQLSVVLLATPMGCTPWLSWQQRWDCFHMVLFLLCFSLLSWGCVTFLGSWWVFFLFPRSSSSKDAYQPLSCFKIVARCAFFLCSRFKPTNTLCLKKGTRR